MVYPGVRRAQAGGVKRGGSVLLLLGGGVCRLSDLSICRLSDLLESWRDGPKGHGGVRRVRWRARAELVQTVRVGGRRPGGGTFGRATAGGGVLLLGAAERVGGSRYGVVALDASAAGGEGARAGFWFTPG